MNVQLQDVEDKIKFFFVPHVGITTKWEKVENNLIEAFLKLLLYKRDNERLILTLDAVRVLFNLETLVKEALKYKNKLDDKNIYDFVKYIFESLEVEINGVNCKEDELLVRLKNVDIQGVYEMLFAYKHHLTRLEHLK